MAYLGTAFHRVAFLRAPYPDSLAVALPVVGSLSGGRIPLVVLRILPRGLGTQHPLPRGNLDLVVRDNPTRHLERSQRHLEDRQCHLEDSQHHLEGNQHYR